MIKMKQILNETDSSQWKTELIDFIKSDARHLNSKDNIKYKDMYDVALSFIKKYKPSAGLNDILAEIEAHFTEE